MTEEEEEHLECWHDLACTVIGGAICVVMVICIALVGYTAYAIHHLEIVIK